MIQQVTDWSDKMSIEQNQRVDVKNLCRITWIDVLKGYGMILVIASHTNWTPYFFDVFYGPIYLTVFLVASGYTFSRKTNYFTYILKRADQLLVPFLLLGIILFLTKFFISCVIPIKDRISHSEWINGFIYQIRGKNDILWFIAFMFSVSIFFPLFEKLKEKKLYFSLLLCALLSIIFNKPLFWHIQIIGIGCFYVGIGYVYKQKESKMCDKKYIDLSVSFLIYMICLCINYLINEKPIQFNVYGDNIFLYFVTSISGVYFFIILSNYSVKANFLSYIGRNTLIILAFHGRICQALQYILAHFFSMIGISLTVKIQYILCPPLVIATCFFCVIPIEFFNKWVPSVSGKGNFFKNIIAKK